MLARGRATSRPNAIHEEHARAMFVFQIVDVGLEARGICNTNTSTGAGFVRNDNTRRVAVGVERVRLLCRRLRLLRLPRHLFRLLLLFHLLLILRLSRLLLCLLRLLRSLL
ncbi:MAG: hypothetical protein WCD60_04220 [Pseudolabrys sp.]